MAPLIRVVVSSEAMTAALRRVSRIASRAASSGPVWRSKLLAIAPSEIDRPNISSISRDSRSKSTWWLWCRYIRNVWMRGPNGAPGGIPSGAGALNRPLQQRHRPHSNSIRVV